MDGTEVSPEALAGKTGHLKMEVTYTNTSKTTKTVNGKKTDILFTLCYGDRNDPFYR